MKANSNGTGPANDALWAANAVACPGRKPDGRKAAPARGGGAQMEHLSRALHGPRRGSASASARSRCSNALLTFHPETVLTGDDLIVFPSNEQIALRAHGMPSSTMRRHLALLVDAGLIIRRDSPNGKRYARKGRDGAVSQAFGFDLSPLVARAAEIEGLAEEVHGRGASASLRARADHARQARHRQDDRHGPRGGHSAAGDRAGALDLGETSTPLIAPWSRGFLASAGLAELEPSRRRARRARRRTPEGPGKSRQTVKYRAPMAPAMSTTYRIQTQNPLLILNLLSRKAGPRHRLRPPPNRSGRQKSCSP